MPLIEIDQQSGSIEEQMRGQALADRAESMALALCVFPHNAKGFGEDAHLARLLFKSLPAVAALDGGIPSGRASAWEGWSPSELAAVISDDMEKSRPIVGWLAPHLSQELRDVFSKGKDSSLNPVFDRLAELGGYERKDILAREAAGISDDNAAQKTERLNRNNQIASLMGLSR